MEKIAGLPWYKEEDFEALLIIFEDSDKLHRTHDKWLAAADRTRKALEAEGTRVIIVYIDPIEFPKWCVAKGHKLDAKARNAFAAAEAYRIISTH